jgi:type I restriction enzyme, S subunit
LLPNDIIISARGTVGELGVIVQPMAFNQSCYGIRANCMVDNGYLYYLLKEKINELKSISHGSVFSTITRETFDQIEIILPPLPLQQRIDEILSALDDKIELNRYMNQTLEHMAQALYKHHFIDEIDPENLPEGWKAGNILVIADLLSGGTPQTEMMDYWGGNIKWISAKDITENNQGIIIETEKQITELGLRNSAAKLLPKFTTVITARGTVGKYCLLGEEMTISQSNYGLKSKSKTADFFIFLLVENMIQMMRQYAYGTVFDTITTKTFQEIEIILPPTELILSFEKKITALFQQRLSLTVENQSLIAIRDILLPKLISGELIPADLVPIEHTV